LLQGVVPVAGEPVDAFGFQQPSLSYSRRDSGFSRTTRENSPIVNSAVMGVPSLAFQEGAWLEGKVNARRQPRQAPLSHPLRTMRS